MRQVIIELQDVADFIAQKIRIGTKEQGHGLTGALERSTKGRVQVERGVDGLVLEVVRLEYGEILEMGVDKKRIPYNPGSGAKNSKYISALLDYVKKRNLKPMKGQTQLGIAFAIARSQKRDGMPTRGSRRFSKTGKRTGAIKEMDRKYKKEISAMVEEAGLVWVREIVIELMKEVINSPIIKIEGL